MKLNSFMIFLISQTNCVPISADNKEAIECLNSSNAKKLRPGTGNHEIVSIGEKLKVIMYKCE